MLGVLLVGVSACSQPTELGKELLMIRMQHLRVEIEPSSPVPEKTLLAAAEQGDTASQRQLAQWYADHQQLTDSARWWSRCANLGERQCVKSLGYVYAYGDGVARDAETALLLFQQADQGQDPELMNSMAWLLATLPQPQLRDPQRAMILMQQLEAQHPIDTSYHFIDTMAAVNAALGHFVTAAKLQQRALTASIAQGSGPEELQQLRERLQLYRAGKPYIHW